MACATVAAAGCIPPLHLAKPLQCCGWSAIGVDICPHFGAEKHHPLVVVKIGGIVYSRTSMCITMLYIYMFTVYFCTV